MKPKSFDMTLMDDTPLETPHYENPTASDLSHRINRRLDFEKQELNSLVNKNRKLKTPKNTSTSGRITT